MGHPPRRDRHRPPSRTVPGGDRQHGHRGQRPGQAETHGGRLRLLDRAGRGRLGGPWPGRRAAPGGRARAAADALHLRPGGHRQPGQRRSGRAEARAAGQGDHQLGVLAVPRQPDRRLAGDQYAVRGGVRGHRSGAGGPDHRQRGCRGGDRQLPADRRAQVHRVHPRPGHRHLPGPNRPARPRRSGRGHSAGRLEGAAAGQRRQHPVPHQRHRPAVDQHPGARGDAGADRAGRGSARAAGRAAERGAGDHGRAGPAGLATGMPPTGWPPGCRCPGR